MKTTVILQMTIRAIGLIQLILGIVVWTGNADSLILLHILLGSILTLALFALTFQAYRAGVPRPLVIVAAVWGLILPVWGLAQEKILPESIFWVSQVLHLICGVGAIGLAEMLGARIKKSA